MAAPLDRRTLHRVVIAMLAVLVASRFDVRAQTPSDVSEDVLVPGGIASLARALEIDPPDHARCLAELVRLVYVDPKEHRLRQGSSHARLIAHFIGARSASPLPAADFVPVPLSASLWSRAVFGRAVTAKTLFAAILSDENAALLAHGLAALDDDTLRFFAARPELVTTLYKRHAPVFASFAPQLRIQNNRVVPPGGNLAVPLWEAVLGEQTTNPVPFVTALYARANGRFAYLYDIVGHLDPPRAAFALGLWLPDPTLRVERFGALARVSSQAFGEWSAAKAFSRPVFDLLALLARVQVAPTGAPRFPASRSLWAATLKNDALGATVTPRLDDDAPIDAAWLAEAVLDGAGPVRSMRLDQFAFGQRAFGSAHDAAASDLIAAIGSFPRVPALMLTVERTGVQRPAVYAALARHAEQLTQLPTSGQWRALAQFQAAIAIVQRMARVRTLESEAAGRLLTQLAVTPIDAHRGYAGAVAAWLDRHLRLAVAGSDALAFDDAVVQALAGRDSAPAAPLVWEGQRYLFDLRASESARINRFLARRRIASIESTLRIHTIANRSAGGVVDQREFADAIHELRTTLPRLPHTTRIVQRLTEQPRGQDASLALFEAVDVLAADALMTLAYASEWHDTRGVARLDRDLVRRHDFGLTTPPQSWRMRSTWRLPRLVFKPGQPWHVEGAAIGLDVALASLALRSVDSAPPTREPRILTNYQHSFVTGFGLLNVFALRDADRDAIVSAVTRGQRRIDALTPTAVDVAAVIGEIAMDGWRARALRWTLVHAPDRVRALFSMTELLHLGGGAHLDVHAWGTSGLDAFGCLCTHVPSPRLRTALIARHQLALLPATVPDLNLRIAVALHELRLPAPLAKHVLEAALYDFLADVGPMHFDDWLAFVRRARALPRDRIEDYLAVVTAADGPLAPMPAQAGRTP